jgi:tetratricopeptide (TPR) repeat protein
LRYRAFISYSHVDEKCAAWLHRALESYRVPSRLVGSTGAHGKVPRRLTPVFRDRDELTASADLGENIKAGLADSESLIVLCSPDAARSKWVNEEIRYFRELGKGGRIYCLVVSGDPQSSDPGQCCFPPAILEGPDGEAREPLAADVRKWADGKTLAKLKLVAAVLGIRLDDLRQRELRRKWRFQALLTLLLVTAVTLVLFTWQSRQAEQEAHFARKAQQELAEGMLARFLSQTERLGDVADLETRKAFEEALSGYLSELDPEDLTLESRRQLGVVLSNRGVILRDEGRLEQAMNVFVSARQTLMSLVEDAREDAEALFALSQVEYWIGQVSLDRGLMEEAAASFRDYADVSAELHRLEPDNPAWTMEVAYSLSNLGNLEMRKVPSNPRLVLDYFRSALEYNEKAASMDKRYESELPESHAYLADAWLGVCDIDNANENRRKNVALAEKYYMMDMGSNRLKQDYAYALTGLARVQQMMGQVGPALDSLVKSIQMHRELLRSDPNNVSRQWNLLRITEMQSQLLYLAGKADDAKQMSASVKLQMENMIERNRGVGIDQSIAYNRLLRDLANRLYHEGEEARAESILEQSAVQLAGLAQAHPQNRLVLHEAALSWFYWWDHDPAGFTDNIEPSRLIQIRESLNDSACSDRDLAARIDVMQGRQERARSTVAALIGEGYRELEFMAFCAEHSLCDPQEPLTAEQRNMAR